MWVSKRFDLSFGDLAFGLAGCVRIGDADREASALARWWAPDERGLACLSVRSGFDALLTTLSLPEGSEVLFTAVTVGDMPRIAEHHGLVPVPVDVDPATMTPSLDDLNAAVGPATRAVVFTHVFGGRADIEAACAWARDKGLFVVEDCAQAVWNAEYRGHPGADVSLFSFGPIKHLTALGGALVRAADSDLLSGLRTTMSAWPVQSRRQYATRLLKYSLLHLASFRLPYWMLVRTCDVLGVDHDRIVNQLTRGFRGGRLLQRLRVRPCAALTRLLRRRLETAGDRLARREEKGRMLIAGLGSAVDCPGGEMRPHSFWLFPVLPANVRRTVDALRASGFDATVGRSFAVVAGPDGTNRCANASRILGGAIFLPFYPAMDDAALERMARVVRECEGLAGLATPDT